MSIESAKAFYSRMTTDQTFRTQLEQAGTREERQQILQAAGYDFTSEDWEAVKAQFQASSTDSELSDAELTAVSGGKSIVDWIDKYPITPLYGMPIDPLV